MRLPVSLTALSFWLVCGLYAALPWLYSYPPLVDLPHHVVQVSLLRDMWLGTSTWAEPMQLRLNYFTPYLIGYIPAAVLALFVSPLVACKIVLSLSFLAFVFCGVRFLRFFGAPSSLIWLLPLSFHGFSWQAGLFTFLTATPLVFELTILAARFARRPNRRDGALLSICSAAILFSHLLVGLFAVLLAGLFVLYHHARKPLQLVRYGLLFLPAALLLGLYVFYSSLDNTQPGAIPLTWDPFPYNLHIFIMTATDAYLTKPFHIRLITLAILILILIPATASLFGLRWKRNCGFDWLIPPAALLLMAVTVPYSALDTEIAPYRFSLFLLPFLALLLDEIRPQAAQRLVIILLPLCLFQITAITSGSHANQTTSRDFLAATAQLPEGAKLLNLTYEQLHLFERGGRSYINHPAYYQVERGGWVDFSFTVFRPQIVRQSKPSRLYQHLMTFSAQPPSQIDWQKLEAWRYDYYVIWYRSELPAGFFYNPDCSVTPISHVGAWWVFKKERCVK
jgi:hypothetical protein